MDAVGRHEDGAWERCEFFLLVLPCCAVVSVEVGVLFEFWVAVCGQHFAVGVDGDAFALGLLQDCFEVFEVVSRDKYGFALLWRRAELLLVLGDRRFRCCLRRGVP